MAIARDGVLPLVSNDHYNGPLFHALMAAGFAAGAGLAWPRLLALVCGALAVGATFALGRGLARLAGGGEAGATWAGSVAALLMATSFIPVAVNSHIAWSNSTTPLWTTLFLWALVESVRRDDPRLLIPAGLLGGLAQQTHPSVLAILVGAALWLALVRPRWLRTRWPWLGALAAAVALANLLVFNARTAGGSVDMALKREYAFSGEAAGPSAYLRNLGGAARLGWQMVGSTFQATIDETTDRAALRRALLHPGALAAGLTALAALAWGLRRRALALPALLWLAACLILPVFNQAWHHYILARYLAPLLPPTFAAIGVALGPVIADSPSAARRWPRAMAAAWLLVLALHPLLQLRRFYVGELAQHKTNARLWQLGPAVAGYASPERPVWLDYELRFQRTTAGGNVYRTLKGFLDAQGADYEKLRLEDPPPTDLPPGTWLVLGPPPAATLAAGGMTLSTVDLGMPLAPAAPGDYALYEVR